MIEGKTVTAIILAAGNSTRYGQNRNKNLEDVNGKTVMLYSISAFYSNTYVDNIAIAVKKDEMEIVKKHNRERKF